MSAVAVEIEQEIARIEKLVDEIELLAIELQRRRIAQHGGVTGYPNATYVPNGATVLEKECEIHSGCDQRWPGCGVCDPG